MNMMDALDSSKGRGWSAQGNYSRVGGGSEVYDRSAAASSGHNGLSQMSNACRLAEHERVTSPVETRRSNIR